MERSGRPVLTGLSISYVQANAREEEEVERLQDAAVVSGFKIEIRRKCGSFSRKRAATIASGSAAIRADEMVIDM
jgi:tryptophan synthase alpha subunit